MAGLAPGMLLAVPDRRADGVGQRRFPPGRFRDPERQRRAARLGHAYSAHGVGGNLGYALAPIVIFGLARAIGWRGALMVAGLRRARRPRRARDAARRARVPCRPRRARAIRREGAATLFRQPAILACFAYFAIYTIGTIGLQTFAPATLNVAYDIPLALATSAVTALLLGSDGGHRGRRLPRRAHDAPRPRRRAPGSRRRAALMLAIAMLAAAGRAAAAAVRRRRLLAPASPGRRAT